MGKNYEPWSDPFPIIKIYEWPPWHSCLKLVKFNPGLSKQTLQLRFKQQFFSKKSIMILINYCLVFFHGTNLLIPKLQLIKSVSLTLREETRTFEDVLGFCLEGKDLSYPALFRWICQSQANW